MYSVKELIEKHPFFNDLEIPFLDLVTGCASLSQFSQGAILFREGEQADYFYIIRHGRVALDIHVPERGSITLYTLGEGDIVGVSWLFPPYRWTFDARAVEAARVIVFHAKCLREKCDNDPSLGYSLMKRFALVMRERLQSTRMRLIDMYGQHQSKQ